MGPYARLRLEGVQVRERAGGAVIARLEKQRWNVGGHYYSRLDVEGRLELQFLDGRNFRRYGPAPAFSSVDGIAFCGGEVLAYIDVRGNAWTRQDDGAQWPVLLIEPRS